MHGSPQAVFTSFKLPKPGGDSPGMTGHGPISPVTSVGAAGFGSRLFPMGLGNPPTPLVTPGGPNNNIVTPPKVSAPLGGLPALADQILMQQQLNNSANSEPASESNNNKSSAKEDSVSPPGTPPPAKRRNDGESSGSEGTPPKNQGLIKAKGTYYPLTAFPTSMPQGPVMRRDGSPPRTEQSSSGKSISEPFKKDLVF